MATPAPPSPPSPPSILYSHNFELGFMFIMSHEDAGLRGVITYAKDGIPTKWGIDGHYYPDIDIENLPLRGPSPSAEFIYHSEYWTRFRLDSITIDPRVPAKIVDMLVNPGMGVSARMVQALVSVPQNGIFGPVTISRINLCNPDVLLLGLCHAQAAHYNEYDANSPDLKGLLTRAADILKLPDIEGHPV